MDFIDHRSNATFQFKISSSSERAKIDDSGNLLVGKSSTSFSTVGAEVRGVGQLWATRDGGVPISANRLSSDGYVQTFYKAGALVGGIGTINSTLTIGSGDTGILFNESVSAVYPWDLTANAGSDGLLDLGIATRRWKDLHIGGNANIGGNAVIAGDLTVNGTTTTINTATLDVKDKNITLNYGAGDTSSTADGAGITIQDAVNSTTDATILWRASANYFDVSHAFGRSLTPSNATGLYVSANNVNATALRIFQSTLQDQLVDKSSYGFSLNYRGDLTGNNNKLVLLSDNQDNANQNTVFEVLQDGKMTIAQDATFSGTISSGAITSSGTISAQNNLTIQNSAAYGSIELGGVSGGFIDIKRPFSDDFDLRLIAEGDGGVINVASGELTIQRAGSAKLATTSTGIAVTGNAAFADNGKAIFGAGSDLQIYHDGSHSYISEGGTGNLQIQGQNLSLEDSTGTRFFLGIQGGETRLYNQGNEKVAVTSTGIDVTGTVTADSVEVDGLLHIDGSDNANVAKFALTRTDASWSINNETNFRIYGTTGDTTSPATKRFEIGTGGDISFYEDTGTTAKFFWDASAERFGLGTTSPNTALHLSGLTGSPPKLTLEEGGAESRIYATKNSPTNSDLRFQTEISGTIADRMVINYSGNVGIGTSSIDNKVNIQESALSGRDPSNGNTSLTIEHATDTGIQFFSATQTQLRFGDAASTGAGSIIYNHTTDTLRLTTNEKITFEDGGVERMRLDASGNLLVGQTSATPHTNYTTAGSAYMSNGQIRTAAYDMSAIELNRTHSDGDIAVFRKQGTTVGSVGTEGGNLVIDGSSATGKSGIEFSGAEWFPRDAGANTDGAISLGDATNRFKDLYLSSGIKTNNNAIDINSGTSNTVATFTSTDTEAQIDLVDSTGSAQIRSRNDLRFYVNGGNTRAVDINSSGNLLVGKTTTAFATQGAVINNNGSAEITKDGGATLFLNRLNSDGDIVAFYKDGSTVGSIGTVSGLLTIGTSDAGIIFNSGSNAVYPWNVGTNGGSNGLLDLGVSDRRWKDFYMSGTAYVGTSIGIGTSSPSSSLTTEADSGVLVTDASGLRQIEIVPPQTSNGFVGEMGTRSSHPLVFNTVNTERMRIDSAGRLGLGTSSPAYPLHVWSDTTIARFGGTDTNDTYLNIFKDNASSIIKVQASKAGTGATNVAINPDGGNLLVGTTSGSGASAPDNSATAGDAGIRLSPTGFIGLGANQAPSGYFNRIGNDGDIVKFNKDGTTVGSIGTRAGFLTIGEGAVGLLFQDANSRIEPTNMATLAATNGVVDIGGANQRFKDLYLSGTVFTNTGFNLNAGINYNSDSSLFNYIGVNSTAVNNNATYKWRTGITGNATGHSLTFSTIGRTESSYSERMRIDASGNLLVGKTTTSNATAGAELNASGQIVGTFASGTHILGRNTNDGSILEFQKDGTTVGSIGVASSELYFSSGNTGLYFDDVNNLIRPTNSSGALRDNTVDLGKSDSRFKDLYLSGGLRGDTLTFKNLAGSERTRIDASGNQLWGKTAANNTTQGIRFLGSSGFMSIVRSNATAIIVNRIDGDGTLMEFRTSGTTRGSISISGSTTSYNTTSDERAKENIVDAPSASNDIDAIRVRSFDFKADGSHQKYGMVAQELSTVAPEAVSVPDDADEMQSVDYSKLVPMMLKEIQTLRARVAQLEGEN